MKRIIAAAFGLALMPAIALAGEKEPAPDQPDWRGTARQALEELGRALDNLEGMVDRMPSYGMPYLDRRGNIVIPREQRDSNGFLITSRAMTACGLHVGLTSRTTGSGSTLMRSLAGHHR